MLFPLGPTSTPYRNFSSNPNELAERFLAPAVGLGKMERVIRRLLRRHGIELSKRLGQHLLVDHAMLERIAAASGVGPGWHVIEIGAGAGNLTVHLARTGARITAIELDERFRPLHEEVFCNHELADIAPTVDFWYGDALAFDYRSVADLAHAQGMHFAVVGNIPYQITSPLVAKLVLEEIPFDAMTLLMQREVAERLATRHGGRQSGSISLKVNFYCYVELLFVVPRRLFLPPPQVESQLVRFSRHEPLLPPPLRPRFFSLLEAAYAQRRKILGNTVAAAGIGYSKQRVEKALQALGLPASTRAEQLGLNEFLALFEKLNPATSEYE
ncbi:MAG: 16S rRNA (adenine(1518)-N(6)/adenine(1519)-N(6))-dimethyltransferase RsmA [Candidatus Sumerlaeaceae bacterium]